MQSMTPATGRLTAFPPRFEYVKAVNTDVQATWRRHGWTAPDPRRHAMIRNLLNRF
jgi:hypothetical protein